VDQLIQGIHEMKKLNPEIFPIVLHELLSQPNSPMIDALSEELRNELIELIIDESLNSKKLKDFLGKDPQALEDAVDEMLSKMPSKCPYLFGALSKIQISENQRSELLANYGQTAEIEIQRGRQLDPETSKSYRNLLEKCEVVSPNDNSNYEDSLERERIRAQKSSARGSLINFITGRWIGEAINSHSSGQRANPITGLMGLFFKTVGGVSQKGFDILSKLAAAPSRQSTTDFLYQNLTIWMTSIKAQIETWRANKKVIFLIHGDNYNVQRWHDLMKPGDKFTKSVDSFTLLMAAFNLPGFFKNDASYRSMPDINEATIAEIEQILLNGEIPMSDIIKPEHYQKSDVSLENFTALPSLNAKSSSKFDMMTQFVCSICYKLFGMNAKPVVVGVDPEPTYRIMEMVLVLGGSDGPLKDMILPPALFHSQEHLLKQSFADTPMFALLICSYLKWMQYRPRAYKSLQKNLFEKLKGVSSTSATVNKHLEDMMATAVFGEEEEELAELEDNAAEADDVKRTNIEPQAKNIGNICQNVIDVDVKSIFKILVTYMQYHMNAKDEEMNALLLDDDIDEDCLLEVERKLQEQKDQLARTSIDEEPSPKKGNKKRSIKTGEYISMKKLKYYLEGLLKCYELNKVVLVRKYECLNNPLIEYVFSLFDEQLTLAITPFQDVILHGNVSTFYQNLPAMICYWGWGGHTNLVKIYIFNLIILNHWVKYRKDILQFLCLICKWINDVYIEHQHSIMARIIQRMFPGGLEFNHIRIAAMLGAFSRFILNLFLRKTHTSPIPSSIDAEVEDMPFLQKVWNVLMSALRKYKDWRRRHVPPLKMSEPKKQVLLWENATQAKADLSNFLFSFFDELAALDLQSCSSEEKEIMKKYRPIKLARKYVPHYLDLFNKYRANALKADSKAKEDYKKHDLELFLENHTVVHTLSPLWTRLVSKISSKTLKLVTNFKLPKTPKKKADFVKAVFDVISNLEVSGQPLRRDMWLKKAIELCDGSLSEIEPYILHKHESEFTIRDWDRCRLWEYSNNEFSDSFLSNVMWRQVRGKER